MDTETMDRLFLELSQFTQAKTRRELELGAEVATLRADLARVEAERDAKMTLTPTNAKFLADLIDDYIEKWGDPEKDCRPIRDALRIHAKGGE